MGFLSPLQICWMLAAAVIVLMYLRWGARASHPSTTLPIWRTALGRRGWWSRWRRKVSVAAACVPVLLIALALAQPFLTFSRGQSRSIVVVIDNTASMNAAPHSRSRLESAKRHVRGLIRNLRTGDEMAILSADSVVRVRCGLTGDRTVLHKSLDGVQPTDGVGAMHAAIATAQRLAADQPRAIVLVVSDAAFASNGSTDGSEVVWHPIDGSADNVAITRFASRPSLADAGKQAVLVEVANYGREPVNRTISLSGGGADAELTFELASGQIAHRVVELPINSPTLLTATLHGEDALDADNTAQLVFSPAQQTKVLLVTEQQRSPVELAMESLPQVVLTVSKNLPEDCSGYGLAVFSEVELRQLPSVPALVIGPRSESDLWTLGDPLAKPQAASVSADHPLVEGIDLRDVIIERAASLRPAGQFTELAATLSGALLYWLFDRPSGEVAVLAIAPRTSDIAVHEDFPRLIQNAVLWLARDELAARQMWTTKQTWNLSENPNVVRIANAPEGFRIGSTDRSTGGLETRPTEWHAISPYGDQFAGGANLSAVGVWRLQDVGGNTAAALPVNLADREESNLAAREGQRNRAWPYASWLPDWGPLWSLLAALALIWVAGHWAFYQRGNID